MGDGAELRDADVEQAAAKLGDDGRAVRGEHLPRRLAQTLPTGVAEDAAQEGLGDRLRTRVGGGQHALREVSKPAPPRLGHELGPLEQRQRANPVGIPQREVERRVDAVAPPDHERRRRRERLDQRRRVVGLLVHVRGVRLRALAPGAAAAVVRDRASTPRQLLDRAGPRGGGAPRAVDAEDRLPGTVLLVVQPHAVDTHLGHADQEPSSSRTSRAPATIASSLRNARPRGRYFIPQSGATTSRSGGTISSALRIRPATTSAVSTSADPRSSTPRTIDLSPTSRRAAGSSPGWAASRERCVARHPASSRRNG